MAKDDFADDTISTEDPFDGMIDQYFDSVAGAMREGVVRCVCRSITAYAECSPGIQAGLLEMAQIIADPDAGRDDVAMAISTFSDAMWPDPDDDPS